LFTQLVRVTFAALEMEAIKAPILPAVDSTLALTVTSSMVMLPLADAMKGAAVSALALAIVKFLNVAPSAAAVIIVPEVVTVLPFPSKVPLKAEMGSVAVTLAVSLMSALASTAARTSAHVAHSVVAADTERGSATIAVVSTKHTAKRSAKDFFAICFIGFLPFFKFAEETLGIDKVMIS
jgi:hypothetical protein